VDPRGGLDDKEKWKLLNHAGNKQKASKIMKMKMFVALDKARPDTENIRGLNLEAVMCTTVQVSRLP
jgi:hypothetical protein